MGERDLSLLGDPEWRARAGGGESEATGDTGGDLGLTSEDLPTMLSMLKPSCFLISLLKMLDCGDWTWPPGG